MICSLLFLSGDVHINPGPVQFPCGTCKRSVNRNHRAVMCDACDLWYHIGCVGISHCEYFRYLSLSDFNWICQCACSVNYYAMKFCHWICDMKNKCDIPPQFDDDVMEVIGHVPAYESVRLIHHNVQGLLSKVTKVSQWLHRCENSHKIL